jgi:hypothetical protein
MLSVDVNVCLRCNAEFIFRVVVHLENDEPHAALLPHDIGKLLDVLSSVQFGHSVYTVSKCAHLQ